MSSHEGSSASALRAQLRTIVGPGHVLTTDGTTRRYRRGYRYGDGPVLAVVRPGTLIEQWQVAQACLAADVTMIMQAANTGLTGGSTPDGDDYPNGVVIVSTTRITGLHLIDEGRQVVCLPGTTLYDLERALAPLDREPHSVIGSSCIGASVLGGVCNNSGGSLIQRGPSFTQYALFARVTAGGELELVNHLGIRLGNAPETILQRLQDGDFTAAEIEHDPHKHASNHEYAEHVRAVDADTPARYNADPRCLFEASGSAGKLILFAARLDTFPKDKGTTTFYIGTNDPGELNRIRRTMLGTFEHLPIAAEYMHRAAFDIAARYGKDTFVAIQHLGTDRLPLLFGAKARVDAIAAKLRLGRHNISDRLLQIAARAFPRHLPRRLRDYRDRYEHHLMLKVTQANAAPTRALLAGLFPSGEGDFFECTPDEATKAFLHRFAAAGAAVRYRAIHARDVEDIVALDIALPRNEQSWFETLPPEIDRAIIHKLYYGHFFCHVFHQDYIVRKGHDPVALEHAMWTLLNGRRAEYPAEHNVGHLYKAKPALAEFYRTIDPRNQLNPGIGQTSKARHWGASGVA
ncbi:D-lactate dehydrogenase [Sphingomonas crusticola]|uniref:D-lactate dehydrogenase n=1 Tax=Sphingomonas crusticola TaxID=1697973 RepID=UPI000E255953|nr:D-lactate dehydrogenase [Sphingomonas crusticola]